MLLFPEEAWAVATIWAEARGEPQPGKVGVAEVIRNRAARHYSSDGTIAGTVLHPLQFSCWNTHDGNRLLAATIDSDDPVVVLCREAWAEAEAGSDFTLGALLYYNPQAPEILRKGPPPWVRQCRETARLGRHRFLVPLA